MRLTLTRIMFFVSTLAAPAGAQEVNLITQAASIEGNCWSGGQDPIAALSDGDPTTYVDRYIPAPCELDFRFDSPVTASAVKFSTVQAGTGDINRSNYVSVWASHQQRGYAFFRLGEAQFDPKQGGEILFEEPIRLRALKVSFNVSGEGGWPRGSSGRDTRVSDLSLIASSASAPPARWPRPVLAQLKGVSDPIGPGEETACDELAGMLFNPDGNGVGRSDLDINVPAALSACELAVADQPDSPRLATNLARAELKAERAPRAIARLSSSTVEGYAPAQVLLAESLEAGVGVQKNIAKARAFYEAAAAQDYGPALDWLGVQAMTSLAAQIARGEAPADTSVDANLTRAIEVGYVLAAPILVEHGLQNGLIPAREAYDLSEAAAMTGEPDAMNAYGVNLSYGFGLPTRRDPEASVFYARAAKLNRHYSMTNFALNTGDWYWNKRAAYSGEFFPLEMVARGISDKEQAAYLAKLAFANVMQYARSETQSDGWSMEWLADYYTEGFGVEKDLEQAKIWRCRARAAGNPRAFQSSLPAGLGECVDE